MQCQHTTGGDPSGLGGTATANKTQRRRSAAQYDEEAMARKREYWRTKKREQRAAKKETNRARDARTRTKQQHVLPAGAAGCSSLGGFVEDEGGLIAISSEAPRGSRTSSVRGVNPCLLNPDGSYQHDSGVQDPRGQMSALENAVPKVHHPQRLPCKTLAQEAGADLPAKRLLSAAPFQIHVQEDYCPKPAVLTQPQRQTAQPLLSEIPGVESRCHRQGSATLSGVPSRLGSQPPLVARATYNEGQTAARQKQRLKLSKVVPQLHGNSVSFELSYKSNPPAVGPLPKSCNGAMEMGKPACSQSSLSQPNGPLLNSCPKVPEVRLKATAQVHSPVFPGDQTQSKKIVLNGNSPTMVQARCHQVRTSSLPVRGQRNLPQACNPKTTTPTRKQLSVGTLEGVNHTAASQGSPTTAQKQAQNIPNSVVQGCKIQNSTRGVSVPKIARPQTGLDQMEEEKAARRREYWRIKKREQRAKLTATTKERIKRRHVESQKGKRFLSRIQDGQVGWPQRGGIASQSTAPHNLPCNAATTGRLVKDLTTPGAPPHTSTVSLYPAVKQETVRPLVSDLQSPQPVCNRMALPSSAVQVCTVEAPRPAVIPTRRCVGDGAAAKIQAPADFPDRLSLNQVSPSGSYSAEPMAQISKRPDSTGNGRKVISSQVSKVPSWRQRLRDGDRWNMFRSKIHRHSVLETQRLSNQGDLKRPNAPRGNPPVTGVQSAAELEDERLARRREYWRIKKREQRAKLTAEAKARMKERDAHSRRIKRCLSILGERHRERLGFENVQNPRENILVPDVVCDAIGGFIKEDGTMSGDIPPSPADCGSVASVLESSLPSCLLPKKKSLGANQALGRARMGKTFNGINECRLQSGFRSTVNVTGSHLVSPVLLSSVGSSNASRTAASEGPRVLLHSTPKRLQHPQATMASPHSPTHLRQFQNFRAKNQRQVLLKQRLSQSTGFGGKQASENTPRTSQETFRTKPLSCHLKKVHVKKSEEKAMAVKPPSQPAPIPEDVRMARKREYWRVKKREQRAKRAARERKGMLSKSLEPQDFMNYSQSSMTNASSPRNNTSNSSLPDAVVITQMPQNLNISPNSVHQMKLDLNACSVHPEKSTLPGTIKQELNTASGCCFIKEVCPDLTVTTPSDSLSCAVQTNTSFGLAKEPKVEMDSQATEPDLVISKQQQEPRVSSPPALQVQRWQLKVQENEVHCYPLRPDPGQEQRQRDRDNARRRMQRLRQSRRGDARRPIAGRTTPIDEAARLRMRREYWRVKKQEQRAKKAAEVRLARQAQAGWETQGTGEAEQKTIGCLPKAVTHSAGLTLPPSPGPPQNLLGLPETAEKQEPQNGSVLLNTGTVTDHQRDGAASFSKHLEINETKGACSTDYATFAEPSENVSLETQVGRAEELPSCALAKGPVVILESQQDAPASSPEGPRVRRWKLRIQESDEERGAPQQNKMCESRPAAPCKATRTMTKKQLDQATLQQRREYWRLKKQEQRAKTSARKREMRRQGEAEGQRWQQLGEMQGEDEGQWFTFCEESNIMAQKSLREEEAEQNVKAEPCEDDVILLQLKDPGVGTEGPEPFSEDDVPDSEAGWRTRFLMDYDPQTALLVCMVCGVLQHQQSLESVRSHIAESHPHSLSLSAQDKHSILEAWDEQVSLRERFFSSQLKQGGAGRESPVAEIEVLVDSDEQSVCKKRSSTKVKRKKL
ncbi:uncharacterized protein LOC131709461 isoform X2 [Acipenser ruthenus]|nr:uncharacterized protein LOC131709461 isoform X2 [Acipenser ruthenus]